MIERKWSYTLSKWVLRSHYHVSIFPELGSQLRDIFDCDSGVDPHQKFNTYKAAIAFVRRVRRALTRQGIQLKLKSKDLAKG